MQYLTFRVLWRRIRAIGSMMRDKTVPLRKKLLVVAGIVYLFLPVDLIPPILGPVGFIDDLVLWIWIVWHLKDTLDTYWLGEKGRDLSQSFRGKNMVEGVDYTVHPTEGETDGTNRGEDIAD